MAKIPELVECHKCGGYLPLIDNKFPPHYIRDMPFWIEQKLCPLSDSNRFRRQPKQQPKWLKSLIK